MKTHRGEILALLKSQIHSPEEVAEIAQTADNVAALWVNPVSGGTEAINLLIYGLVQSGKTGVLATTAAIGADAGYRTIVILTSDILPLYNQTLGRAKEWFPGLDVIDKTAIKDQNSFLQRIKSGACVIVVSKNASVLHALVENFKKGNVKGLSALIIDDEADQASLNTKESKADGSLSTINQLIVDLRAFFDKNTYLQVTATPQALFMRPKTHGFRPKRTVLSHPGSGYVGGDEFFSDESSLVVEFDIADIESMSPGAQPGAAHALPDSLMRALDVFMIAATFKRSSDATQNCAFLCHVSSAKRDHDHIVKLLHEYRTHLKKKLSDKDAGVCARFKVAYETLCATHEPLRAVDFDTLLADIKFYSPGIAVKLVNGDTDEDVAVNSPLNLFVGGQKLGRGVTIRNLLVSYYGRHPKKPQADTVLQHARMYGYRRPDIGLLRLFLPPELHRGFKAITKLEQSLRRLIESAPTEEFRGVYLEGALSPTRKNVLAPGSLGFYTGGSNYNPAQILRDGTADAATQQIDTIVAGISNKGHVAMPLEDIRKLIELTRPDESLSEGVWDTFALAESVTQLGLLRKQSVGYVFVDRDREVVVSRRETAGILAGGEVDELPADHVGLFMLRQKAKGGKHEAWWPQVRFPDGRYAFAFAV